VWEAVLAQQIEYGLPAWSVAREFQFLEGRRFRFDFAWPGHKIAVEVEGGTFVSGRHNRGLGMAKDMEKYNLAAIDGWAVLRVTPHQIRSGDALRWIKAAFDARGSGR
jgi:very-short-patch-repair endonuclease